MPPTTPPSSAKDCDKQVLLLSRHRLSVLNMLSRPRLTVLRRRRLPVARACQSSVRAEIPQVPKVLNCSCVSKEARFAWQLSFLHLYSDPIAPSPSGPLLMIVSWTCFLPYLFQLFPSLYIIHSFYFSLGNLLSILFVILYPFNPTSYLEK